jgi:hypothetical protein
MNQIEEWAVGGFDERQPFSIPSTGIAKKNFGSSVVLTSGRQPFRLAHPHPPIGERHGESGSEERHPGLAYSNKK